VLVYLQVIGVDRIAHMQPAKPPLGSGENFDVAAAELVSRLFHDIVEEGCVVFLGAGCTTERTRKGSKSFYEHIKHLSGHPGGEPSPSFPELMEYFCDRVDGGRHNRLIREALSRIEYFSTPGEENRFATAVGSALAEIPYFNRFVTTNWDPFLERSLGVLVATVEDRDLAFWDDRKRQVLKIHGCITRPYSIVATQSDYEQCMKRNPLIFNKLKDLMATKAFLFAGYSMQDSDFQQVWEGIIASLGHFSKLAYALAPHSTAERISFWKERGIQIYKISDLAFMSALREKLEGEGLIARKEFLQFLRREEARIVSLHLQLDQNSPGGLASAMYQDGLLHGLEDVLTAADIGTKKRENFESELMQLQRDLANERKQDSLIEIAYLSGRCEAIIRFSKRAEEPIPAYFHPYGLRPVRKFVRGDKF